MPPGTAASRCAHLNRAVRDRLADVLRPVAGARGRHSVVRSAEVRLQLAVAADAGWQRAWAQVLVVESACTGDRLRSSFLVPVEDQAYARR